MDLDLVTLFRIKPRAWAPMTHPKIDDTLEDHVNIVRVVPIQEPIVLDSLRQRPQPSDLRGSLEV
jgi:hypothetical protein